jgi:hypothetical protein
MNKRVNPISPSAQIDLGLEGISEQMPKKRPADPGYREIHEKYNPPEKDLKAKAAENEEFKDKRVKSNPLAANAEIARMKEILNAPKGGGSTGMGGGGGGDTKFLKPKYKAGGKVSSASKRADGCAVKGKTRGRMV